MFALVLFDDGVYYICRTNRITSKSGDTCCVKYTDGGRYPARQLSLNADRKYLEELKKTMQACDESENNPTIPFTTDITNHNKQKKKIHATTKKKMLINNRVETNTPQHKLKNRIYKAQETLNNDNVLTDTTNENKPKNLINKVKALEIPNNNSILTDTCKEKIKSKNAKEEDLLNNNGISTFTSEQNKLTIEIDVKKKDILNNNRIPTETSKQNKQKQKIDNAYHTDNIGTKNSLNNDCHNTSNLEDLLKTNRFIEHETEDSTITLKRTVCRNLFANDSKVLSDIPKQTNTKTKTCNITSPNADHLSYSATFSSSMKVNRLSDIFCSNQSIDEESNSNEFPIKVPEINIKDSNVQRTKKLRIISDEIINISTVNEISHISESNSSSDFTKTLDSGINEESLLSCETSVPLIDTAIIPSISSASEIVFDTPHNSDATSTPLQRNPTLKDMNENGMKKFSDSESEYEPSADDDLSNATSGKENSRENSSHGQQSKNRNSHERRKTRNSSQNSSANVSSAIEPKLVRDDADMFVAASDSKRGYGKRLYCMYCQTMQSKFARHIEFVHKDVTEVKAFSALPKRTAERKKIIDTIRKNCQFSFNTDNNVNDGELIVCRRPKAKLKRRACDFQVCHSCKGFYSKNNIRHHAQQCFGYNGKKGRTLMVMGRQVVAHVHSVASERLTHVFSVLREDEVVRIIRYDRLLILYGNKLCRKYKKQHDGDMIRAHLRMLGRLLIALKKINKDVIEFASLYDPKFYDDVISAINIVSKFDEKTSTYKHPSTAYSLGSFVKQIGNLLITDCIKRHDVIKKANTEDFLKLALDDIGVTVNKTVVESQTQQKRRKKTELPSIKDIKKLLMYLDKKRNSAYRSIQTKFNFDAWLILAQTTLTSVQVFNRRRAGEIERVFIEDFESYEGINKDLLKTLSSEAQVLAKKYVRFTIRGKLNRTVPVLLSSDLLACIKMILKYRDQAGVPPQNRYVFGIPGFEKKRHKYLRACYLMRNFAKESGADFPAKLTGTRLRKHVATNCINLNLSDNEVNDVANFMGHAEKIHREHYRQPIVSREILRMSKVLELAQGGIEHDEESDVSKDFSDDQRDYNNEYQNVTLAGHHFNETYDASGEVNNTSHSSEADSSKGVNNVLPGDKRKATTKTTNHKRKKRSTSPYGAVKSKPRWTQIENEAAFKLFGNHIKSATYPSLKSIQSLCRQYPCLVKRSPTVIKTWISNKIKQNRLC